MAQSFIVANLNVMRRIQKISYFIKYMCRSLIVCHEVICNELRLET